MNEFAIACNLCGAFDSKTLVVKDGFRVARCRHCSLVYVGNPPDQEYLGRHYSFEAGYHEELKSNSASVDLHDAEARRNLALLNGYRQGGTLLDIGCSTGLFMAKARAAGWSVCGCEYSDDSAAVARAKHGLDVVSGALQPDCFAAGSFDVVTLWDVLEHVPDPQSLLRLAATLLKADGLLVVKTPNVDGLYPRWSLKALPYAGFWGHPEPPGHLFQFSARTLARMVLATGLTPVGITYARIPLRYSFGSVGQWFRSFKWAAYCLAFIPLALAGPALRSGDDMTLVARRKP